MTARRAATLAIVTGLVAAVLVVVAASGDGGDDAGGDADWVWGLVLILAPLACAGATRSVAASALLRPVGGVATAVCALASLVHLAFVVDERGASGWLYGLPAIATPVLLLAAVITGPVGVTGERRPDRAGAVDPMPPTPATSPAAQTVHGPPLDVVTPLREARSHAVAAVAAWAVVLAVAAVTAVPALRLTGWPRIVDTVEAEVVSAEEIGDRTLVSFEGRRGDGERVRWSRSIDDSQWAVGDRREVFVDDEGRFHFDQQFGLAGIPLVMPVGLVGGFALLALRRLWGLAVATWDVSNGGDAPRLGYAAVIDDPAPRTYRCLLAVWEDDPTRSSRLPKPDAVYRGDPETSEDLESPAHDVAVRRAWIDTGPWRGAKPRWIGFEDGVGVPHRRSFCGRWYVHVSTKRSEVGDVVELHHGPPEWRPSADTSGRRPRHSLPAMVAWRVPLALLGIALAHVLDPGGFSVS